MIPRHFRLGRSRVLNPRLFHTQHVTVAIKESSEQFCRIRIVVGKKRIKRAVERNKIRRAIATCLTPFYEQSKKSYDMILTYKGAGETDTLCSDITSLLTKAGVIL